MRPARVCRDCGTPTPSRPPLNRDSCPDQPGPIEVCLGSAPVGGNPRTTDLRLSGSADRTLSASVLGRSDLPVAETVLAALTAARDPDWTDAGVEAVPDGAGGRRGAGGVERPRRPRRPVRRTDDQRRDERCAPAGTADAAPGVVQVGDLGRVGGTGPVVRRPGRGRPCGRTGAGGHGRRRLRQPTVATRRGRRDVLRVGPSGDAGGQAPPRPGARAGVPGGRPDRR